VLDLGGAPGKPGTETIDPIAADAAWPRNGQL